MQTGLHCNKHQQLSAYLHCTDG